MGGFGIDWYITSKGQPETVQLVRVIQLTLSQVKSPLVVIMDYREDTTRRESRDSAGQIREKGGENVQREKYLKTALSNERIKCSIR